MNIKNKIGVVFLLLMPFQLYSQGFGVYIPYTFTEHTDYNPNYNENDITYDPNIGIGLAFDTNLGKDSVFNYRLNIELFKDRHYSYTSDYGYSYNDYDSVEHNVNVSRFNIVNTFGFGLVRTKTVRLWIGPRTSFQYEEINYTRSSRNYSSNDTDTGIGLGIAPAIGLNINLGKHSSLAFDLDYRLMIGSYTSEAATARVYYFLRFGETYNKHLVNPSYESSIDYSL